MHVGGAQPGRAAAPPLLTGVCHGVRQGPLARGGEARVMKYVGRASSASTATASFAIHKQEMQDLIDAALTADDCVHEY